MAALSTPKSSEAALLPQVVNVEFTKAVCRKMPTDSSFLLSFVFADDQAKPTRAYAATPQSVARLPGDADNYLSCSSFRSDDDGKYSPSPDRFAALHLIVLHDLDEVALADIAGLLAPSWSVATGGGRYEVGFVLDHPITDFGEAKKLQETVASQLNCSLDDAGPCAWARLPVGLAGGDAGPTDPSIRLQHWNPATQYSADKLQRALRRAVQDEPLPAVTRQPAGSTDMLEVGQSEAVSPLAKYSLRDRLADLEKNMVDRVPILGDLVLLGQATAIYAKPNTGKTLITLQMIIEGVRRTAFDPARLFYINMDDDSTGLVEKLRIAEDYGFHMLADGYEGFDPGKFLETIVKMTETETAKGTIVVLDTLTKFVDTMDKAKSRGFAGLVRRFVLKGGTVIALAHTNKKADVNGNVVYAGTTDIVDNIDCAYTLSELPQNDKNEKMVVFKNFKSRGKGPETTAYSYAVGQDISYPELLSSVRIVDPEEWEPIQHAAEAMSDAEMISAIEACIREGVTQKMRLRDAVAKRAKVSERQAIRVIEQYAGDDPATHRWDYTVRARGAKVFALLDRPSAPVTAHV